MEIQPIGVDANRRHNESSISRYPNANNIICKLQLNRLVGEILSKEIKKAIKRLLSKSDDFPLLTADKEQMQSYFKNDLEKLEKLIGKCLSEWRS